MVPNEKLKTQRLLRFQEDKLPYFLRKDNTIAVLKKTENNCKVKLEKVRRCIQSYIEKCKSGLEGVGNKIPEAEKEASLRSKDEILESKILQVSKENIELEAAITAKMKLIEEEKHEIPDNRSKDELKRKLANLEKDWIMERESILQAHKQNLYIYKFYEKNLNCKLKLESSSVIRIEFRSNCYIRLNSEDLTTWKLLEVQPNVSSHSELAKLLEETNDVQGLIASVRNFFELKKSVLS